LGIYYSVDTNGKTIRQLDTSKYYTCFLTDYSYFAIFGKKDFKGWAAIDANENVLFKCLLQVLGRHQDYIIENKLRLLIDINLIGFANNKGRSIKQV
jgi:hypothetical protein